MFGPSLGSGDYGHLTIDHASMLLRIHRSLRKMSNQGFEAAHKLQRQLYAKSTSHDCKSYTSSCKKIVICYYATMYIYIHTYIHTYIRTCMYMHTYIHIHTYMHAYIYIYVIYPYFISLQWNRFCPTFTLRCC